MSESVVEFKNKVADMLDFSTWSQTSKYLNHSPVRDEPFRFRTTQAEFCI